MFAPLTSWKHRQLHVWFPILALPKCSSDKRTCIYVVPFKSTLLFKSTLHFKFNFTILLSKYIYPCTQTFIQRWQWSKLLNWRSNHSRIHSHTAFYTFMCNLRFSILPKYTLMCWLQGSGIELLILHSPSWATSCAQFQQITNNL